MSKKIPIGWDPMLKVIDRKVECFEPYSTRPRPAFVSHLKCGYGFNELMGYVNSSLCERGFSPSSISSKPIRINITDPSLFQSQLDNIDLNYSNFHARVFGIYIARCKSLLSYPSSRDFFIKLQELQKNCCLIIFMSGERDPSTVKTKETIVKKLNATVLPNVSYDLDTLAEIGCEIWRRESRKIECSEEFLNAFKKVLKEEKLRSPYDIQTFLGSLDMNHSDILTRADLISAYPEVFIKEVPHHG